jgi:hypothetical protein
VVDVPGTSQREQLYTISHETRMPYKFGWLTYRVALQLGAATNEDVGALACPSSANAATISRIERQTANLNATEAADCLGRTENLRGDLRHCLDLYVSKGGGETSMTIQELQQLEFAPHASIGAARTRLCSDYYSDQEASAVWEREGKFA